MHLTTLQTVLAITSGGLVGFTLGLIGGGGSILAVPLLLYVVGIHDAHVVIGTTALAVAVNAFINLIPHWRAGHVRWKAAILFAIPGAIGAVVGSIIGKWVDGKALLFLFAILMLVIAVRMLRSQQRHAEDVPRQEMKVVRVLGTGAATGLVSGFFGIGGGFLIVPGLMFATGMAMIEAIGSSLFSVGTFGLTTAVSYAISGLVDWWVFALYVIGGIVGGVGGTLLSSRLGKNKRALQVIFAVIIIVVAVYMLYDNLSTLHW
ncbi:MAG: sulfite exporter TauE/SafE family protein [Alicyclobacillus sp.]|nr:sulfite exporter TauE/SafE family protein [Alicyclobacillus sp.]